MIGIYKITNPNGRVYIGQSINITQRFNTYRRVDRGVKTSPKLYRSLLKYGYVNHKFEIIEECSMELLNERERFYQDFYNATSKENLNCILTSTETKSGVGVKSSDKAKQIASMTHKGKVLSEETRNKIKLARSKQIITKEHREAISKNNAGARLVLNLQNGVYYRSAKEAAEAHNIKHNTLVGTLLGRNVNRTNLIYA